MASWRREYGIEGCIVNAYFLYKNRETRASFNAGLTLREYLRFEGLLVTDSGAFQGLTRRLLLSNKDIVVFQEMIGTDIASPLDLITPPGDNRTVAQRKLEITLSRVRQAMELVERSIVAGVQQGGRFLDLRRRSVEELMRLGVEYVAIGSLVPFFTRNHDLRFVGAVLRDARQIAGPEVPIHVYGAGDPVELPFMVALGADVFDSSSYAHYARERWYMTRYGALRDPAPLISGEYTCSCPACAARNPSWEVMDDERSLAAHNLWTITDTIRRTREVLGRGRLDDMLEEILERHSAWFPGSALREAWEALHV
jgi:7-cyano-7-deazaguanine tRNA-ribosyltransferase